MRIPYIFINSLLVCVIPFLCSPSPLQILIPINVKISNIPIFLNPLDVLSHLSSILIQILIDIPKDRSD